MNFAKIALKLRGQSAENVFGKLFFSPHGWERIPYGIRKVKHKILIYKHFLLSFSFFDFRALKIPAGRF